MLTDSDSNLEKIKTCPAGYYCKAGIADFLPHECPEGFYCPEGSYIPLPCKTGKYCSGTKNTDVTGSCAEGYFCELSTVTAASLGGKEYCMNEDELLCVKGETTDKPAGKECPVGFYCE